VKVEFVNLKAQTAEVREELDRALDEVLTKSLFILGPNVSALEREIADLEGARYAVALNSGTDALILPLLACGVGPGDEVITSPFTFVANIEAICIAGATPVFADIDENTFLLNPDSVRAAITPRTKAIIPVHLFGQLADMDAFSAIAREHNLRIIADGAQAIEANQNGKGMGSFPDFSTLSFYPTKNLGAAGDAGMVLTNDEEMYEILNLLRFHGSGGGYIYKRVGFNSRLDEIQAAVLRIKLRKLHEWNQLRRANAAIYDEAFAPLKGRVATPVTLPGNRHVYHVYTIRVESGSPRHTRDALRAYLADREIGCTVFYELSLHLQEAYARLGYKAGDMPVSERVTQQVLCLPIHAHLTHDQVRFTADSVIEFFQNS
jgi:dTDP-4-amino-4,6-dideoxygalactose transaminase